MKNQRPPLLLESLAPSRESLRALDALHAVLGEAAPLKTKHRLALRGDIRKLWEELTSDRESRGADYLGSPSALSAYLRYFLPWNMFRLSAILGAMDLDLARDSIIADLGSGPLTLPMALWACRPELRSVPLKIYCLDRVDRVLRLGLSIFETLCLRLDEKLPPWSFELRRLSFGDRLPEKVDLLTAANVFNEFFWKDRRLLGERALDTARSLASSIRNDGGILIMEPGDPRSASLISALRAALEREGLTPRAPCPHSLDCPMPGMFHGFLPPRTDGESPRQRLVKPGAQGFFMPKRRDKYPWCHFGIDASFAPAWLKAISSEAGLPKEKVSFSYLWAAREPAKPQTRNQIEAPAKDDAQGLYARAVSEDFILPGGRSGQYACSRLGYSLITRPRDQEPYPCGALLKIEPPPVLAMDVKSGAVILPGTT